MKIYTSIDTICPNQWKELLDNSATSTFFQTPECYRFYESLSFLKPFVLAVSEDHEHLAGLVCGYVVSGGNKLKRYFSRRAIVPGGLLLSPEISTQALSALLKALKVELENKAIYLEIRNYNDYSSYLGSFISEGYNYLPHYNFQLQTPDVDFVKSGLSQSKRRQVKSTLKAGFAIEKASTEEEVAGFYEILKELYSRKIRLPLFPLEFFLKLINQPFADIFLVKKAGKIYGGIACVYHDSKTVYEWFVCGKSTKEAKVYPSVLATWAGIEYAACNGFDKFDFMGAGKPGCNYGVREFKSKFGGELLEPGRFLMVNNKLLYSVGKLYVSFLKTFISR